MSELPHPPSSLPSLLATPRLVWAYQQSSVPTPARSHRTTLQCRFVASRGCPLTPHSPTLIIPSEGLTSTELVPYLASSGNQGVQNWPMRSSAYLEEHFSQSQDDTIKRPQENQEVQAKLGNLQSRSFLPLPSPNYVIRN